VADGASTTVLPAVAAAAADAGCTPALVPVVEVQQVPCCPDWPEEQGWAGDPPDEDDPLGLEAALAELDCEPALPHASLWF
jgi:hypothetical protein